MHATDGTIDTGQPSEICSNAKEPHPTRNNGMNTYVLEYGCERIRYRSMQKMLVPASLRYTSFHGACFICKCMAHSQKFCPLRKCNLCDRYGHAEVCCPYKKKGLSK